MPQLVHSIYIRWWDRFATPIQIPNFSLPSFPSALSPLSPSISTSPPPISLPEQIQKTEQNKELKELKGKAPMVSEPCHILSSSQSSPFSPPERFFANQFAILQAIHNNDDFLEPDTPFFEDSQDPYDYSPIHLDDIFPLCEARPLIFKAPPTVPITMGPIINVGPTTGPTAGPTVDPIVVPTLGPPAVPFSAPLVAPPGGPRALARLPSALTSPTPWVHDDIIRSAG